MQEGVGKTLEEQIVMESDERHWTRNDELIERFALNQLNPEERNELEDHLRICEVCKQAVRREQTLVAGIRRSGRETFKATLRKRLSSRPVRETPWPHILSAAAVVLIITGIGLHNRWFEMVKDPELPIITQQEEIPEFESRSESPNTHPPEPTPPLSQRSVSPTVTDKQVKEIEEAQREIEASEPEKNDNASGGVAISSDAVTQQAGKAIHADKPSMEGVVPSETAIVIVGQILVAQKEENLTSKLEKGPETSKDIARFKSKKSDEAMPMQPVDREVSYSIQQQHMSTLAPDQFREVNEGQVITTVKRIGSTIYITLYLDSMLDDSVLSNIGATSPSPDSLILNLPGKRIVYKLPPDIDSPLRSVNAK